MRLAEPTQHASTLSMAYLAGGQLPLLPSDWAKARAPAQARHRCRTGRDVMLVLPLVVADSAWVLAQLGEAGEATSRLREGEELLKRYAAGGHVSNVAWACYPLGRACLLLGRLDEAQRLGDRALAASPRHPGLAAHALRLLGSIAMPSSTGSTPRAARPSTVRRWRSPRRGECVPSWRTATSASARCMRRSRIAELARTQLSTAIGPVPRHGDDLLAAPSARGRAGTGGGAVITCAARSDRAWLQSTAPRGGPARGSSVHRGEGMRGFRSPGFGWSRAFRPPLVSENQPLTRHVRTLFRACSAHPAWLSQNPVSRIKISFLQSA